MELELIFTRPPERGGYHSKHSLYLKGERVEGVYVEEDGSLDDYEGEGAEIIFYKFMPLTLRGINEYKKWVLSVMDRIHDEYGDMWANETCGLHISFEPSELAKKPAMMIALEIAWHTFATRDMKERYFRKRYSVPLLRYNGRYTVFAYRDGGRRLEWRGPNLGIAKNYSEVRKRLLLVFKILTEAVKLEKKIRRDLSSLKKNRNKYILTFTRGGEISWDFHYVFYGATRFLVDIRWWHGGMEEGFSGRTIKNAMVKEFLTSEDTNLDEEYIFNESELFMNFFVPYFFFSSIVFLRKLKKRAYKIYEEKTLEELEKNKTFDFLK